MTARIQWTIGLLFVASFIGFSLFARFPIPYRDDWDWLHAYLTRGVGLGAVFEPHNEHVIALPRLLVAMQYSLDGLRFRFLFAVALAAQLVVGWVFLKQVSRRWPADPEMRRFVGGLALVPLFLTYQLQSVVFAAAILFPLVQMFVVVACAAAVEARQATRHPVVTKDTRFWWGVAIVAALGAGLTTTNGLLAPIAIGTLWAVGRARAAVWAVPALLLIQLAFIAGYVVLVAGSRPSLGQETARSLESSFWFFVAFFGSGAVYSGQFAGLGLGLAVLAAVCWCVVRTVRDANSNGIELFAVGLFVFALITAAMTAVGRAQFGLVQAAQSRYSNYTFVCWAALVLWVASRLDSQKRLSTHPLPLSAVAALTLTVLCLQAFVGLVWVAKRDNLALAALALQVGVDDDDWTSTLHPLRTPIFETRTLLLTQNAWPFSDRRVGTSLHVTGRSSCHGNIRMVLAPGTTGWRLAGELHAGGSVVALVSDGTGVAVGVLKPAPLVAFPNPTQLDVVGSVWRSLRRSDRSAEWSGFARRGEGPPYTLFALDARGEPRCELAIASHPAELTNRLAKGLK